MSRGAGQGEAFREVSACSWGRLGDRARTRLLGGLRVARGGREDERDESEQREIRAGASERHEGCDGTRERRVSRRVCDARVRLKECPRARSRETRRTSASARPVAAPEARRSRAPTARIVFDDARVPPLSRHTSRVHLSRTSRPRARVPLADIKTERRIVLVTIRVFPRALSRPDSGLDPTRDSSLPSSSRPSPPGRLRRLGVQREPHFPTLCRRASHSSFRIVERLHRRRRHGASLRIHRGER